MDARAKKLTHFGIEKGIAEKLVNAGFDLPKKIKNATNAQLRQLEGIGDATVAKIRIAMRQD